MTQVRQPIYHSSIGRWRRYQDYLGPLLEKLGIDHCFGVRQDQIELAARLGQTFSCNFDTENTKIIEEDLLP